MNRPLVYLVLAMAGGIVLGAIFKVQMTVALAGAVLAWMAAGIGILRTWRYNPWVLFVPVQPLGVF
ncbi:hypothetical protein N752_19795 [Desulforamulus aquiferis]|nr:hypothetical protein [Desulforamulus aquiferis]RYD03424.1 hypothetical protein N752_19795 [Desulforamulus aquiferis]